LNIPQNILIVLGATVGSLFAWWSLLQIWPAERRREHNDITGWQLSVIGTTYAVIIGFMLFAAWADFRAADQNAEVESTCLITLYWAASGLPESERIEIQRLAESYAHIMIDQEWPAMEHATISHEASDTVQQLWATVSKPEELSVTQQVSLQQTMQEISSMAEHRRIRQMQSQSTLPSVLWVVLIVGAVLTLVSACLFGSLNPRMHVLQIVTLALLLSLALIAVGDVNRPFRGFVHVQPQGFENALRIFQRYSATHASH
jgi:hypothetical protein